ncbi:Shedu anti-phage system protein SduA domain-containing protein [Aquimarina longa]|uniref:Shedu anti-phage system protein SduA domain-containing protein n=1 Tax=Aquimarina longa TaxID=1080221 RepID=UPI0007851AAE|nr:Shedu anti-phage system protein SduA domain-containing protein [Aquimarina longa]
MKILINDFTSAKETYKNIFRKYGYEENELIFCDSFEKIQEFIIEQLENKKLHIDAIITNESSTRLIDSLQASKILRFRNGFNTSYSKNNFRISSIPVILYTDIETSGTIEPKGWQGIVQKNKEGQHDYFISKFEEAIKDWRRRLINDLENLGVLNKSILNFQESLFYKTHYRRVISDNSESYFLLKTSVVSQEFIKLPTPLIYDWLIIGRKEIEKSIMKFNTTYNEHIKYDRKNNERTILHDFFNQNKMILLRDAFIDLEYEKNLYNLNEKTNEECDYILKTEFPEFLKTTFFEVKKEDVTFYVKKKTKRPQLSSKYLSHLEQVWRYKEYSENEENSPEIESKLGYKTTNFDHILLAGRKEEKLEMRDKFSGDLNRMFNGIDVVTYEELEELNIDYYDKFNRLSIETK